VNKTVNSENAVAGVLGGDDGGLAGLPGDGAVPEALRRALREEQRRLPAIQ
jgi:hypothetical protein